MTIQRLIVGHLNNDEEQINALARIIEELEIEPIDQLIGTPENPVPEDVDFYSLLDVLDEIVKKLE